MALTLRSVVKRMYCNNVMHLFTEEQFPAGTQKWIPQRQAFLVIDNRAINDINRRLNSWGIHVSSDTLRRMHVSIFHAERCALSSEIVKRCRSEYPLRLPEKV